MFNFFRAKKLNARGSELHPEEIFMDAHNAPGFYRDSAEGVLAPAISDRPFIVFFVFLFFGAVVLVGRTGILEIARGDNYAQRAEHNQFFTVASPAERGIVYDRNHKPLALNEPAFSIVFRKKLALKQSDAPLLLGGLARFANVSLEDMLAQNGIASGQASNTRAFPQTIVVADGLSRDDAVAFQSQSDKFPGAAITSGFVRSYPYGAALAAVLGYVGRSSAADADWQGVENQAGRAGVEQYYNDALRGNPGRRALEINAQGKIQGDYKAEDGKQGNALVLNLDGELQDYAYQVLQEHIRADGKRAGAVVISDPRDGAILALVSFPGIDGNLFQKGLSRAAFQKLADDPSSPFLNRAIAALYPAGSVIKPMMASAALEEKVIDPSRKIFDEGFLAIPNPYRPGEQSIVKDWKALGWVDMRRAIAYSANVYFYTIGGGYGDIQGLGVSRIKKYLSLFGFGEESGIDLAGEKSGIVPDADWKTRERPRDPVWRLGDTYHISIGQGDMQVTPLQINMATAAIANRGILFEPRIAREITDERGVLVKEFLPVARRSNFVSRGSLAVVREGMRMAVTEGSASALSGIAVPVAGKTGTAETGRIKGETHAWFTGFAPYDNPEIAITVLVERGGEGSLVAVPIARDILEWWAENRRQKTSNAQE